MSRTPLYRVIVEDIRDQIRRGQLPPGSKLPSITKLADEYECSQTVVKTAIALLRELGEVEGHQGRGVYVTEKPPLG
jgi:GntR family transcriptional regulator